MLTCGLGPTLSQSAEVCCLYLWHFKLHPHYQPCLMGKHWWLIPLIFARGMSRYGSTVCCQIPTCGVPASDVINPGITVCPSSILNSVEMALYNIAAYWSLGYILHKWYKLKSIMSFLPPDILYRCVISSQLLVQTETLLRTNVRSSDCRITLIPSLSSEKKVPLVALDRQLLRWRERYHRSRKLVWKLARRTVNKRCWFSPKTVYNVNLQVQLWYVLQRQLGLCESMATDYKLYSNVSPL